jgi:hypothetical protein
MSAPFQVPLFLTDSRTELTRFESESYITTDGQPASLSWNKASIWGLRADLDYCQTVAGLLMWGALSDERAGLSFAIAVVLASAVFFGSESRGTSDQILLPQIRDFPFRRLLRLAGLRWRYSTPPPHGILTRLPQLSSDSVAPIVFLLSCLNCLLTRLSSQSQVKVTLRLTVSQ